MFSKCNIHIDRYSTIVEVGYLWLIRHSVKGTNFQQLLNTSVNFAIRKKLLNLLHENLVVIS